MLRLIQLSDTHLSRAKPHFTGNWGPVAAWLEPSARIAGLMSVLGNPVSHLPGHHDVPTPLGHKQHLRRDAECRNSVIRPSWREHRNRLIAGATAINRGGRPPVQRKHKSADFRRTGCGDRIFVCVYAHHVPGRLRLKLVSPPEIGALNAACDRLLIIPAVTSVRPNHLTGSIVVHYDSLVAPPMALCVAILQLGFSPASVGPDDSRTQRVADAALGKLFEYVVESLAMAAIAAAI